MDTAGEMEWSEVLEATRMEREKAEESGSWQSFYDQSHFSKVHLQLSRYLSRFKDTQSGSEDAKTLIKNTRSSLRVGLSYLSIPTDEIRSIAQQNAVDCSWDDRLLAILSQSRGDSKCRQLCAQLLCNLVTNNASTSASVASKTELAPSQGEVSCQIREATMANVNQVNSASVSLSPLTNNWVDMILCSSKSKNRQALGAIVAALHNCGTSLAATASANHIGNRSGDNVDFQNNRSYWHEIASTPLLVCTLLRQLVSAEASIQHATSNKSADAGPADGATEWIVLLLAKLCRNGLLPQLFTAAGKDDIVPEHVVLLRCLRSQVEDPALLETNGCGGKCTVLGGNDSDLIVQSHVFLVEQWCRLQLQRKGNSDSSCSDSYQESLQESMSLAILDILAETLAEDTATTASIRTALATDLEGDASTRTTSLVPLLCVSLGQVYDTLVTRNSGRKSRDMVVREDEQARLTVLVRVLGNVCFQCRSHQDTVRTSRVPLLGGRAAGSSSRSTDREENVPRCGLHVVLSCTSYAHACFTLREWAVVAIRNVLDGNLENQAVVEELEAQQPVQSTALGDLGIQVKMDPQGKVSVAPMEEISEEEEPKKEG